jgi:hypothetical protein
MSELRTDIRVRAEGSGILGKTIVVYSTTPEVEAFKGS